MNFPRVPLKLVDFQLQDQDFLKHCFRGQELHSRNSHLEAPLLGWLPVTSADTMVVFPQASCLHMLKHFLVEEWMMGPPGCHLGISSRNNLASNLHSASLTEMFISTASLLALAVFPALCSN